MAGLSRLRWHLDMMPDCEGWRTVSPLTGESPDFKDCTYFQAVTVAWGNFHAVPCDWLASYKAPATAGLHLEISVQGVGHFGAKCCPEKPFLLNNAAGIHRVRQRIDRNADRNST